MNIVTLDCLMKIASNCPKFDHIGTDSDPVLLEICNEAFEHWEGTMNRFPGRAHGHQGRKKKEKRVNRCRATTNLFQSRGKKLAASLTAAATRTMKPRVQATNPQMTAAKKAQGPTNPSR